MVTAALIIAILAFFGSLGVSCLWAVFALADRIEELETADFRDAPQPEHGESDE